MDHYNDHYIQNKACYFSLQYYPRIIHQGHKNKGNDHQLNKLLIA